MTPLPLPITREIVLIGGGHAHALVLRKWAMNPLAGARITLINPGPTAPYTGMLPGFVAGHYEREELSIDLVRLARFAGARLILGAVDGMDLQERRLFVSERAPVAYDVASVNVGITSDPPTVPGFAKHGFAAKPLGPFAIAWRSFSDKVAAGEKRPQIAVIGGGVGGIELALAMHHGLANTGAKPEISVVEADLALQGTGKRARSALLSELADRGISLHQNNAVALVTANTVRLADGPDIPSQFTVGTAGARPFEWLSNIGLNLNDGFISVDKHLRTSDANVFAAGDCAALADARPKAGVFAVRQAPVLYHNFVAKASGGKMRAFRPQRDYLKLISLGGKSALADKYGLAVRGPWVWRLKDRIDQKFMDQFRDLPKMPAPAKPDLMAKDLEPLLDAKPMCGGCAAKVGQNALSNALAHIPSGTRPDVIMGAGDDAAVLATGGGQQVMTTDVLRSFSNDPWVMGKIAAIHALGDIWAMGATPQAALATITLPPMSSRLQSIWLNEIMDAASGVMGAAGSEIIGGHTSLGAELMVGFSVTGLLDGNAIRLSGANPGDVLILTKPVGSGTILAAEMQMLARGDHVAAALELMMQEQGTASKILSGAHAMTDVTGFGLAGHLMNMCRASHVAAEINLPAIPLMDGAFDLADSGVRASLYQDNLANVPVEGAIGPRGVLIHDPQTSGGLLAAVDAADANRLLGALQIAGYEATLVGRIVEGEPGQIRVT